VRELQLGLEAFKAPSAASRSGMAAAMESDGKKYTEAQVNLAKPLSDAVKLDELQALKVVEEPSTEIDISDFITEEMVWKSADTYWRERSSLVALLGELVSYAYENENNPDYESIATVETIRS
jgi:hypothetical protein